jgi:hypothetical protein
MILHHYNTITINTLIIIYTYTSIFRGFWVLGIGVLGITSTTTQVLADEQMHCCSPWCDDLPLPHTDSIIQSAIMKLYLNELTAEA